MKMKTVETVNVKQLASHELSVEQQLYYKEITEVTFPLVDVALFCFWSNPHSVLFFLTVCVSGEGLSDGSVSVLTTV
jgi:hypothetical protein